MKYLTLTLFILHCFDGKTQHHNFDTLPQFTYQNVISVQGFAANSALGIYYSRNMWSGLGYRNYEEISIGVDYGVQSFSNYLKQTERVPVIGFDIKLQHNIRMNLKRLFYFSIAFGYSPLVPIKKSVMVTFDDYMNTGYGLIGLSGHLKKIAFGLYGGVTVVERKQDLFYEVHTYAQTLPQIRLKIGYSFGQKVY